MKFLLILLAVVAGALASQVELENREIMAVIGRAIDPKAMDPTQLSILAVLKTAIPTGPNVPLPTGDYEPEWYQKLPPEVKSLLPLLYPATKTATATATDGAKPAAEAVSETTVPSAASSLRTPSLSLPCSTALVSSPSLNTSAVSNSSPSTAAFTLVAASTSSLNCTSRVTVTKTLQYTSTATPCSNSTAAWATGSPNATHPVTSPSPSDFFSAGSKTAIKMKTFAAIMWVGLGVGFFVFA